jgi:hypothetical protein
MLDRKVDTEMTEDELDETEASLDEAEISDGDTETLELKVGSTPVDFAQLGLTEMAYIRQTIVNDEKLWCIYSAAGHPLGAAPSFDLAWAAVKQHNLQPLRVN